MDKLDPNAVSNVALENRITCNKRSSLDLNEWIFEKLSFGTNSNILELCAGTGKQSLEFLKRLGKDGKLFMVDVSTESLKKIEETAPKEKMSVLHLVPGKMEDITDLVPKYGGGNFDLCFCAYGLYYSRNPTKTLSDIQKLLKKGGRIVVVGPYGKNNSRLFAFLEEHGVAIPEFVKYSSNDFMQNTVIPWAIENVPSISIHTTKNEIAWASSTEFMNYWKNSTFFDKSHLEEVNKAVSEHFRKNEQFLVDKHIMMAVMNFEG